jgi:hypothetical protein
MRPTAATKTAAINFRFMRSCTQIYVYYFMSYRNLDKLSGVDPCIIST